MEFQTTIYAEVGGTFRYFIAVRTYNNEAGYTIVWEQGGFATYREANDTADRAKTDAVAALFRQVTTPAIAATPGE